MVLEASGVDEAAGGVVREVPETQGDAAQVLQAPVDCFGGAVGGAGLVEVGQDVLAAADQGLSQCLDLLQAVGDGLFQGVDEPSHQEPPQARLFGAVGLDEALVDAPGGLDRSVALVGEQGLEALGLGVGEQVGPRAQGASGLVERVSLAAPPAGGLVLDAAAALIELGSCQGDDARRGPSPPGPWGSPRRRRS